MSRWILHSKPINSTQVLSYMQVEIVKLKLTLPVLDLKEFGVFLNSRQSGQSTV